MKVRVPFASVLVVVAACAQAREGKPVESVEPPGADAGVVAPEAAPASPTNPDRAPTDADEPRSDRASRDGVTTVRVDATATPTGTDGAPAAADCRSAKFCEDFEKYAAGKPTAPWTASTSG